MLEIRFSVLGRSAGVLFAFACGCSHSAARHESGAGPLAALPTAGVMREAAGPVSPAPVEATARSEAPAPRPAGVAKQGAAAAVAPLEAKPARKAFAAAGAAPNSGGGLAALGSVAHGAHVMQSPRLVLQRHAQMNTENYARVNENEFSSVVDRPLSTFSIDVDTASYANARRFLNDGTLPPKDSIRIEEWLNYFSYDYPDPAGSEPFSVASEVGVCPWNGSHRLVRLGLKTREISQATTPPRNLVFLIDVSGSMMPANKLPLLKRGLGMLADNLRANDAISIVVYAGASGLALPATRGSDHAAVTDALGRLEAGGSTNGGDGIRLAYSVATDHFIKGGINRVILATDGDFNVGTSSQGELERLIEEERKSGVFLTVLGFGEGNIKDSTMELLADKGNGNYAYIDSINEARKVLVREAGATLVTVAKDVKLQVEFNPTRVASYKLIGYEDRLLAKEDFNDDKKDAGDIGAGHSVTALYELIPKGEKAAPSRVDALKYQTAPGIAPAAASQELMTVNIRYKAPSSDTSQKFSRTVTDAATPIAQASQDFRFAAAVAEAGLVLRGAPNLAGASLDSARVLAQDAVGADPNGDRHELVSLLAKAKALMPGTGAVAVRAE